MCALVKGMTDILTPINLLPNSDFSRSHGHSNEETLTTLGGSQISFCENFTVNTYNCTLSNVEITRSNGSVTLNFTVQQGPNVEPDDGASGNVWIKPTVNNWSLNQVYTIGCTFTEVIDSINQIIPMVNLSGSATIYFNKNTNNEYVCIMSNQTSGFQIMYGIHGITSNHNGKTISFTVTNCYMYEGAFCNPPVSNSLDVMPGHQFVLKDDLDYLSTNACLCKYMATAIDTSAALTTTGCIKDISGNGHHTQCSSSSYLATIPYLPDQGKIIQSVSTSNAAYAFNCPQLGLPVLNNDGDYDEMTIFTRFKYQVRSSTSNKAVAVGLEWAYSPGNGQDARANYFYVRIDQNKLGINLSTLKNAITTQISTLVPNHVYAAMFSISFTKGRRNIYVYDIIDNTFTCLAEVNIQTKDQGNGWKLTGGTSSSSNYPAKAFLCSGADMLLMESAMYSCFMNRDNFNYLVDNYHPEIGAAYLGA